MSTLLSRSRNSVPLYLTACLKHGWPRRDQRCPTGPPRNGWTGWPDADFEGFSDMLAPSIHVGVTRRQIVRSQEKFCWQHMQPRKKPGRVAFRQLQDLLRIQAQGIPGPQNTGIGSNQKPEGRHVRW